MKLRSRSRSRAYMLVEIVTASVLVGLAMVMTVSMLSTLAYQRRTSERRGWALQEAANVMERLSALPFERLTDETAGAYAKLSASAEKVLPGGRVQATVREEQGGPPMKRIEVAVSWSGKAGRRERPVRLTYWVSRKGASR